MPIFMHPEGKPVGGKGGPVTDTPEACLINQLARKADLTQDFKCWQCDARRGTEPNQIVKAPEGQRCCKYELDQPGKAPPGIEIIG